MAVRLLTGGWPCQPHSLAGKRLADADERDGWRFIVAALRHGRPDIAFLENVADLLSSNGGRYWLGCLSDLASLGYDAEWLVLGANNAGANHRRRRLWCLAWRRDVADSLRNGRSERSERSESDGGPLGSGRSTSQRHDAHRRRADVADTERVRVERRGDVGDVGDPSRRGAGEGDQRERHGHAVVHRRAEVRSGGHQAQPVVGRSADALATGLVWPARGGHRVGSPGEPQYAWEAPRTTAHYFGRNEALRAIGNGWDIPCAVMAFNELMRRAGFR